MIRPVQNQTLPDNKSNAKYVEFICDCGNTFKRRWRSFKDGNNKSCGKCNIFRIHNTKQITFGKLKLLQQITKDNKSSDLIKAICNCGTHKTIKIKSLLEGVESCGCSRYKEIKHHETKPINQWKEELPELVIDESTPQNLSRKSSQVCKFKCKCGSVYSKRFEHYKPNKSSCGKCDEIIIKNGDKINNFTYVGHKLKLKTKSIKKEPFLCKCGKTKLLRPYAVFHLHQKICGSCSIKDKQWWGTTKFGKVKALYPEKIANKKPKSNDMGWFICDCGQKFTRKICIVTNGRNQSCGKCRKVSGSWFFLNKENLEKLKFPLKKENFPKGGPIPLSDIKSKSKKTLFECWLCKRRYECVVTDIIRGVSLSCGCSSGSISKMNFEVNSFLNSIGVNSELEYDLNKLKYDIAIPTKKLLIEMHGLKWHSEQESKSRDALKFNNAIKNNNELIVIYEDEWANKNLIFKNIISNRLGIKNIKTARANKCSILQIDNKTINAFYEKFHYIGPTNSKYNYGAFLDNELVAAMSFRKPTRPTNAEFELSRMAGDFDIKIHGIWSKLLRKFIQDQNPNSIVTYSDNRLFSGKTYQKIGFKLDGHIKPDYYWVLNMKRFNKSALRKPKNTTITETQLRTSQGYRKIWDYGKTRWLWKKEL